MFLFELSPITCYLYQYCTYSIYKIISIQQKFVFVVYTKTFKTNIISYVLQTHLQSKTMIEIYELQTNKKLLSSREARV